MNLNAKISLALIKFFKKYGQTLLIILIIWIIVVIVNNNLKKHKPEQEIENIYTPDVAIMDDEDATVPTKYREAVKSTIDTYFKNCNSENFTEAYNMLSNDCKAALYEDNQEYFEEYAKDFYVGNKKYYLQNYSNVDNKYIYELYIIDDIETTGGTGGYDEKKEKITVIRNGNEYEIANQGYVENKKFDNVSAQSEEMKVKVISKDVSYIKEAYNLEVTNKTDKYILISDGSYTDAVTLNLGNQYRNATNTQNATFWLAPGSTESMTFIFDKFVDDGRTPTEINFNDVRIYDNYKTSLKPEDAENLFSFNINLK